MAYVPALEHTVYTFKFTGRSGPEDTGVNLWIQVKLLPEFWGPYRRGIVSDTVDHRSEEVRFLPTPRPDTTQAELLAKQFVEKYYGDKA